MTSQLKDQLGQVPALLPNGYANTQRLTWAQLLTNSLIREAEGGNATLLKEIMDRTDGKVKEQVEHNGDGFKLILGVKAPGQAFDVIDGKAREALTEPPVQIVSFATVQAEIEAENKKLAGAG